MALQELNKQLVEGQIDKSEIIDRIERTRNNRVPSLMTVEDVRAMDHMFRSGGGKKVIFGRTIESLVSDGFLITPDMYRVTTFGPIALEAAQYLHTLLKEFYPKPAGEEYIGIEGCTGAGSQTWGLSKAKLRIEKTIEKDTNVSTLTGRNLGRLGLKKLGMTVHNADITKVLNSEIYANNGKGRHHDWIMLDPDWHGKPLKTHEPFHFSDMSPEGYGLMKLALQVAPVVAIKAPMTLNDEEVRTISSKENAVAAIRNVRLRIPGELLLEKIVYLINKPSLIGLDGDRIIDNSTVELIEKNQVE